MIYEATLQPRENNVQTLEFSWDSETGEITGRHADWVGKYVEGAREQGYVKITPVLSHPLPEGRLAPEDMGAIFAVLWRSEDVFPLPEFAEADLPDGAVS